jgi:hypothetical protein
MMRRALFRTLVFFLILFVAISLIQLGLALTGHDAGGVGR